jgi:aspartyl-tRNA(Asn)/glutamyl-tRNA(Gln) amidotransferase subunit A
VLRNYVMDGIEPEVERAYEAALKRLAQSGARLTEVRFAPLDALPSINRFGFSPIEAYAAHRARLDAHAHDYDPRVLARIRRGEGASAADYLDLLAARRAMIDAARNAFAAFDGFVMPTVPIAPPRAAPLETDDEAFAATNALVLRNPSVVNFLDGCAVSLPCQRGDDAPAGFTVAALSGCDDTVLALASGIEAALADR